jgi:actin
MTDNPVVVIDNGTGMMKAGIAGEEAPRVNFPSVVGVPKYSQIHLAEGKDFYIGQDAIQRKGVLTLEYPLENGIIKNWDYMSKIWHHTYYNELKVDPTGQAVMLTEAPLNPKKNREQMIEIFFEKLKVPAFYVSIQAVLALYASGRTTGLVVDSGDGVTHYVAVYDGYSMNHSTLRVDFAGRNLTDYMFEHLSEDGVSLKSTAEKEIAKQIKEKVCYVSQNFETELKEYEKDPSKKIEYELPDGTKIKVGDLRIRTPECFFRPSILGFDVPGIHKKIQECVNRCDLDVKKDLWENIILSGGSTMFEGMQDRLTKELSGLLNNQTKLKIIAPVERKYSIWIGGSVLAAMATF